MVLLQASPLDVGAQGLELARLAAGSGPELCLCPLNHKGTDGVAPSRSRASLTVEKNVLREVVPKNAGTFGGPCCVNRQHELCMLNQLEDVGNRVAVHNIRVTLWGKSDRDMHTHTWRGKSSHQAMPPSSARRSPTRMKWPTRWSSPCPCTILEDQSQLPNALLALPSYTRDLLSC